MTALRKPDPAALPEAELVALARTGEPAAFRAIMARYNQRLFRVARALVGDDAEAEDVLQEAYVRAFTRLDGFRGEAGLGTWLTAITLNQARERLRRRRRPTVELEAVEAAQQEPGRVIQFPGGTPADPEREAARAEARRLLEHAVDDLPEAFRVVFMLREVEDLSVEETAVQLGIKPETVKTRLHRARRLLREALDARLAGAMSEAFPFLGARCARITERVLARLAE
jgi:RNA polymerase sigma-70 factor (ECF subfamily)